MKSKYPLHELVRTTRNVFDQFIYEHECDEKLIEKLNDAIEYYETKTQQKVKTTKPKEYEEFAQDLKDGINKGCKQLTDLHQKKKFYEFKRHYTSLMVNMYNVGIADALGGEVVEEGECVRVDPHRYIEILCPCCGERIGFKASELVEKKSGVAVKV